MIFGPLARTSDLEEPDSGDLLLSGGEDSDVVVAVDRDIPGHTSKSPLLRVSGDGEDSWGGR